MRIFVDFCLSVHLRQVTRALRTLIRAGTFGPQPLKTDLFLLRFTSRGKSLPVAHPDTALRLQRPSVIFNTALPSSDGGT